MRPPETTKKPKSKKGRGNRENIDFRSSNSVRNVHGKVFRSFYLKGGEKKVSYLTDQLANEANDKIILSVDGNRLFFW